MEIEGRWWFLEFSLTVTAVHGPRGPFPVPASRQPADSLSQRTQPLHGPADEAEYLSWAFSCDRA
eukprot:scaffold46162_cov44-Phaeocystis_antarctica.AAC.3